MTPSQYLKLERQLKREGVFDPELVCYCFDTAVSYFGHYIEARLNEYDPNTHKPKHSLQTLISDQKTGASVIDRLKAMFGFIQR